MTRVREPLKLNVLVEMAVGDREFRELLICNPQAALVEYNRQMTEELNPICHLPRFEVELLGRVAGRASDLRQFCGLVLEERERLEEQKQRVEARPLIERFEVVELRSA